jgi:hypothetical protein
MAEAPFARAGRTLERAGCMARRVARTSMREMTTAARASREPMEALLRNVRLAGRHIARDAVAAWNEAVPRLAMKPAARPRRRTAA